VILQRPKLYEDRYLYEPELNIDINAFALPDFDFGLPSNEQFKNDFIQWSRPRDFFCGVMVLCFQTNYDESEEAFLLF